MKQDIRSSLHPQPDPHPQPDSHPQPDPLFRLFRAVRAVRPVLVFASALLLGAPLAAASPSPPAKVVGGAWQAQGPGPASSGQVENIGQDNPVVGAVHTVVAHPTDADTLWIGGVNGGLWKTTNATAATPSWTRLTDDQQSLSISALALDPTDVTNQTLVAGIGGYSSFGARGDRTGLLRSIDGGTTWTTIDGGLAGKNISGVAPRGSTIVASVNTANSFTYSNIGVWRSIDGGASFTQISGGDGSATGLPGGVTHDLASDPSDHTILFTSVIFAPGVGGVNGVYRSTNTGATWSKVSSAAMDALITDSVSNIEFAVGPTGSNVYAAIAEFGRLTGIFRSGNGGTVWTAMDLPTTVEDGVAVGIHPGGQASIHMSIVADPTDVNIVYLAGDRQPFLGEFSGGPGFFPNSIGALDFSGRIFRGNASFGAGQQWTPLTHSGTAGASSPHADSREMTFDAAGDLVETDDGGIYKRTSPRTSAGDWFSLIGDLQTTEYHGVSYDSNADIVFGGAQDTGTTEQLVPDLPDFFSTSTADGGDTAVDDISTPGMSDRFSSFQFLGSFRKRTYDAGNVFQSQVFPALTVIGGGAALSAQFYTPIAVNEINGDRLIIGASNSVYESFDQGGTISEIGAGITVNAFRGDPIVYGVPSNADLLYVADGSSIFTRSAPPPAALTAVTSPGGTVNDLTIDPDSPAQLFASDSNQVFFSINSGSSWSDVTGNLNSTFDPGDLRTLAFIPGTSDALVVGTDRGVYVAFDTSGFSSWDQLGTGLPNAPVYELDYDAADNVLIAGMVGRGAFKLDASLQDASLVFIDGFESGDVSAWSSSAP